MNISTIRSCLRTIARTCAVLFALVVFTDESARADVVTLSSFNSTARFATEAGDSPGDAPRPGLHSWTVDGTEHLFQQWFWYRLGTSSGEAPVDTLNQTFINTVDLDGEPGDDFLVVRYRDANQSFELEVQYVLTGGEGPLATSSLGEDISVRNLSSSPLDFHLFQYVDFDLSGTAGGDSVVMSGAPVNTVVQTDGAYEIAETVVTPPPSHFEVNQYQGPNGLEGRLGDEFPTTLTDTPGPLVNLDATWAFQWDVTIAPGGSFDLSKVKSLTELVPEPSTFALASIAGIGLLARAVRKRTRRA